MSEKQATAPVLLERALGHMQDRAATYDQPTGERSMGRTVEAFNIITGRCANTEQAASALSRMNTLIANIRAGVQPTQPLLLELLEGIRQHMADATTKSPHLTESEGWLLMQILKDVRDRQRATPHKDSLEDGIAYSALKAEARLAE